MSESDESDQAGGLPEEWSANSNECFRIALLHADGTEHTSFNPDFTYPIFGDNESIFGYKDLQIELSFTAHNLEPRLHISHGAVFPEQGDIKPTDIRAALSDFLTTEAFLHTKLSFTDAESHTPPGEKVRTYKKDGSTYEVWCASLAEPEAVRLLQRMQVLVPLFIEGGTLLQLEQDWVTKRWKLFTSWAVQAPKAGNSRYSLIGYSTTYRVFALSKTDTPVNIEEPEFLASADFNVSSTPLDLPSRERLSQFLVLGGFQGRGHGQMLYRTIYNRLTKPENVREFTVEDPNEAFDDMRDFCDLTLLRARNAEFAALEVNADIPDDVFVKENDIPSDQIISQTARDSIRVATKIDRRQFDRLVEMQTLSKIPTGNRSRNRITRKSKTKNQHDKQYYLWRLYAKKRIFNFNRESLLELDHVERVEKLEATIDSIQQQYTEIIERAIKKEAAGIDFDGELEASNGTKRKRKVVDDDDDEMSDTSKRSKLG